MAAAAADRTLPAGLQFRAPHRMRRINGRGKDYDTRVPPGTAGALTLYCEYGETDSDVMPDGSGGLHRITFTPESPKDVDQLTMSANSTHQDLRYILEARNNMGINFHLFDHRAKLADTFASGATVQVTRQPYRVHDIGTFAPLPAGSALPGADLLRLLEHAPPPPPAKVFAMMKSLGAPGSHGGMAAAGAGEPPFRWLPASPLLAPERAILMGLLEQRCGERAVRRPDFKLSLAPEQLSALVGAPVAAALAALLGAPVAKVWLRRSEACGEEGGEAGGVGWGGGGDGGGDGGRAFAGIPFHLDVSATRTLQVALNDEREYAGGRLVFAGGDGQLHVPTRPAGSLTVHDDSAVHGVTPLRAGVRCGIFLLAAKAR
jgi:hypothetical protein